MAIATDIDSGIFFSSSRLTVRTSQAQDAARNAALPALVSPLKKTASPNWRVTCSSPP
jgi:hypothetical protein